MKFHFFCSLEGKKEVYEEIFRQLEKLDCYPITKHALERNIEDVKRESAEESERYVKRMKKWTSEADFIVVEVTVPDVSIGYEMMYAMEKGKPVIVLYQEEKGTVPFTLKGMPPDKINVYPYTLDGLGEILQYAVEDAKENMDVRFNFFVSPRIVYYLDWIAKKRKIPRAVYLRRLIEKDMEKNKEFSKEK